MTPLITIKGLTKSYENDGVVTPVLHGIDLEIQEGEFVAIMGPSGSGKSTLMHILGFLDHATEGTFTFDGEDTSNFSDDDLAAIRASQVSFVFQAFNLLPRASVLENVILPLLYHPTIKAADREKIAKKAIKQVDLSHREDYLTTQLSGGQKQRVAIARALVTTPKVIFADEPTGNLDSKSGDEVMKAFAELHKAGHTVILVTHEMETAEHAERIITIKDGMIESDKKSKK